MNKTRHKFSAFSLIELLVSVTIMLLIVGGSVAGYTRYTERQRVVAAAEKLQSALKQAQNLAITGYLGDCDELTSIDFQVWNSSSGFLRYRIRTNGSGCVTTIIVEENIEIEGIEIDSAISDPRLSFYPIGYINQNFTIILESTRIPYQATFNIEQGGSIKVSYQ